MRDFRVKLRDWLNECPDLRVVSEVVNANSADLTVSVGYADFHTVTIRTLRSPVLNPRLDYAVNVMRDVSLCCVGFSG